LKYFKEFNLVDILAFGNILGVEEQEKFEDYITEILDAFQKEDKLKRRAFLKTAKDVAAANKDILKGLAKEEGATKK
jgi:GTP cyclohydrolase I